MLDPSDIDAIIIKRGDMSIYYAGVTEERCLALSPTGLVVPMAGAECQVQRTSVCEYQSCYTNEGDECVFPFKYKTNTYTKCISEDVYKPWCATEMSGDNIVRWGLCLEDCEHEVPKPSCLSPPPVPEFGLRDEDGIITHQNYLSSWFLLSFIGDASTNVRFIGFLGLSFTCKIWSKICINCAKAQRSKSTIF